jgi:hypothetical protein
VVEEWDVQNAAVLAHKVIEIDPTVLVDLLVDDENFFVTYRQSNFLFKLAKVGEDVKVLLSKGIRIVHFILFFKAGTHQEPVDLKFDTQVLFELLAIEGDVLQSFRWELKDFYGFFCAQQRTIVALRSAGQVLKRLVVNIEL